MEADRAEQSTATAASCDSKVGGVDNEVDDR